MVGRRVAITGVGVVTALGTCPNEVLSALDRGVCGARALEESETWLPVRRVGAITDFQLKDYYQVASFRRLMSRESALATVAAKFALESAHLVPGETCPKEAVSLYAGTGATAMDFRHIVRMVDASAGDDGAFDEERFASVGLRRINPLLSFKILPNMPPCFLSIVHGIQGDNLIFNPWEGQTGHALVEAFRAVREGTSDVVLVGGSDVKTHSQAFVFLNQVGLLPDEAGEGAEGEPFAPDGRSCIPGEGAGYLVVESEEFARSRGATILAWIANAATASDPSAGWGYTRDPWLLEGLMREALGDEVPDVVVSSADGFAPADEAEADAIRRVAGESVRLLNPKAGVTSTFAAASAIATALAATALHREHGPCRALVNAFGNGRERACLLLEAPGEVMA